MTTTKHDRYMAEQYPYNAMADNEPARLNNWLNVTASKGWRLVRVIGSRGEGAMRAFILTTIWERDND